MSAKKLLKLKKEILVKEDQAWTIKLQICVMMLPVVFKLTLRASIYKAHIKAKTALLGAFEGKN